MKLRPRVTTHAVDRYVERIDPASTREAAHVAILAAYAAAERVERSREDDTTRHIVSASATRPGLVLKCKVEGDLSIIRTVVVYEAEVAEVRAENARLRAEVAAMRRGLALAQEDTAKARAKILDNERTKAQIASLQAALGHEIRVTATASAQCEKAQAALAARGPLTPDERGRLLQHRAEARRERMVIAIKASKMQGVLSRVVAGGYLDTAPPSLLAAARGWAEDRLYETRTVDAHDEASCDEAAE